MFDLRHGDCLDVLRGMADNSVDAIVTDPPYGLSFMGKRWDYDVPSEDIWRECLRVLKPGGHLLAFAGTRTQHRMAVRIEDAGFEIRDMIAWVYASGFPKSLDVSKAIDKGHGENRERQLQFTAWMRSTGITVEQINEATGSCMASHYLTDKSQPAIATADMFDKLRPYLPQVPEYIERLVCERTGLEWTAYKQREVVRHRTMTQGGGSSLQIRMGERREVEANITAPATPEAQQWQGWGTALKPALEPITVVRKPLIGTVAENVLTWGTGGVNVDGCRVETPKNWPASKRMTPGQMAGGCGDLGGYVSTTKHDGLGRWPANLIHDGSEEVVGLFPETTSTIRASEDRDQQGATYSLGRTGTTPRGHADSGSAARFFYCAKASKRDRDEGLDSIGIISIFAVWEKEDLQARLLVDTATSPPRVTVESTAQHKNASAWNTLLFGNQFMEQFQTATRYTTSTATSSTIASKILTALAHCITNEFIPGVSCVKMDGTNPAANAGTSNTLIITINEATASVLGVDLAQYPMQFRISASDGRNIHSTVKPTDLMRYLCRLVTPPNGTVLDPFMGSGSTGKAAVLEGFHFIGIEREAEYLDIARARIEHATKEPNLWQS